MGLKMKHNCYFCGTEFEFQYWGSCPLCWTGVSTELIKRVNAGHKQNPPKDIVELVKSVFINENNQETVLKLIQEHMSTSSWNWTKWDFGLVMFAWYLDSEGYEFSTIYRKGKFVIKSKEHFKLLEYFANSIGDFSYIKSVSFTTNKINITMNMKKIEGNLQICRV